MLNTDNIPRRMYKYGWVTEPEYTLCGLPPIRPVGRAYSSPEALTEGLSVFGKQGHIWKNNENSIKVCVYGKYAKTVRTINELSLKVQSNLSVRSYNEYVFTCLNEHAKIIAKLLKVPKEHSKQLDYAEDARLNKHLD